MIYLLYFYFDSPRDFTSSRAKLRKKYAKLSIGADVLQQIVCSIKIRRARTRHDNIDFKPIVTRISKIKPLLVVVANKGYDSEDNHLMVGEKLNGFTIISPREAHQIYDFCLAITVCITCYHCTHNSVDLCCSSRRFLYNLDSRRPNHIQSSQVCCCYPMVV